MSEDKSRMELHKARLFHLDLLNDEVIVPKHPMGDVYTYLTEQKNNLLEDSNKKEYIQKMHPSQVVNWLIDFAKRKQSEDEASKNIAEKLLSCEKDAQKKIEQMNVKIKKGSLIVSSFKVIEKTPIDEEPITKEYLLLTKVDHDRYLDASELKNAYGLSYDKKKTHKSCLICIDDDNEVDQIIISDSSGEPRDYWYNKFLDVEELRTDGRNTKRASKAIDNFFKRRLKNDHPREYYYFRNQTINYFRSKKSFEFSDIKDYLLSDTLPYENSSVDISKLSNDFDNIIKDLKKSEQFDTRFSIDPKGINKKITRFSLDHSNEIELVLKNSINDYSHVISAEIEDGEEYLKVRLTNSKTYETFAKELSKK